MEAVFGHDCNQCHFDMTHLLLLITTSRAPKLASITRLSNVTLDKTEDLVLI